MKTATAIASIKDFQKEVEEVALVSLEKRTQLWDGILRDIKAQTIPVNS